MSAIKCTCKSKECKTLLYFDDEAALNFQDKVGNITVMYLDANSLINLIKEATNALLQLAYHPRYEYHPYNNHKPSLNDD